MLCPNLTFLLFENISTRAGKCYHIWNSKQNHLNLNPSECCGLGSGTSNLLLSAFVSICTAQQLTWSNIFKYLKLGKGWKRNICVFGVLGRLDLSCDIYLSVDIFPRSRTPVLSLNVKTGSRLVSLCILVSFGVPHQCQSECLIAFQCHLVPNRCCRQICHCSNFSRAVL